MNIGPVFLVSMPRAGSTLLSAMLDSHPQVHCPPEPWLMLRLFYTHLATLVDAPFDDSYARTALSELAEPALAQEGLRAHALAIYGTLLARAGKELFVDKTPRYYFIARELLELFPKCRIIILKRDPLAVAASMRETWAVPLETLCGHGSASHRFDLTVGVPALAELEALGSPRVYSLTYESLTSAPAAGMEGLCRFLGVEFREITLRFTESSLFRSLETATMGDKKILGTDSVRPANGDRWSSVFTRDEVAAIGGALGTLAVRRFGYPGLAERLACEFGVGEEPLSSLAKRSAISSFVGDATSLLDNAFLEVARLRKQLNESEADRAARLESIGSLQREQRELRQHLDQVEVDRAARLELIKSLQKEQGELRQYLDEVEADRAARLDLIKSMQREDGALRQRLDELESDRAMRLSAIESLNRDQAELYRQLHEANADRGARLAVIETLQKHMSDLHLRMSESEGGRAEQVRLSEVRERAHSELSRQLGEKIAERDFSRAFVVSLEGELAQQKALISELITWKASAERVEGELAKMHESIVELRNLQQEKLTESEAALSALRKSLSEAEREVGTLREQLLRADKWIEGIRGTRWFRMSKRLGLLD